MEACPSPRGDANAANPTPSAFVLVGPTAVGKSRVAQWIAEQQGHVLLSADSMQVYRGMDIGTAKPTRAEQQRVATFGIDLAEPDQSFSVAAWLDAARAAFAAAAGRPLIVVGGTGLYLRCLVEGLQIGAAPDVAARAAWERLFAAEGVAGLQAALRARDPASFASLADPQNPRRLIRALERAESGAAAGRTWATRPAHVPFAGLRLPPEALQRNIELRVRAMYDQGLMLEIEQLLAGAAPLSDTARGAIGYAEAIALRDGTCTREAAIQRTIQRTRQYAKRQRTWFERQAQVSWIDVEPGAALADIASAVLQRWAALGPTPLAGLAA